MLTKAFYNLNGGISLAVMGGVLAAFYLTRLRNSRMWTIVVTPLASIIGSGFLVVAPLLYQNFGRFHWVAIIIINLFALALGWVIRTNIKHIEPLMRNGNKHRTLLVNLERISSLVLSLSYIISVGFYLSLMSSFVLEAIGLRTQLNVRLMTTAVLIIIGATGYLKGLHGMEGMEKVAVNVKLSIIAGLLVALALTAIFFTDKRGL